MMKKIRKSWSNTLDWKDIIQADNWVAKQSRRIHHSNSMFKSRCCQYTEDIYLGTGGIYMYTDNQIQVNISGEFTTIFNTWSCCQTQSTVSTPRAAQGAEFDELGSL